MVKREKNDSGLNLCRAFKARPSMNRVKYFQYFVSAYPQLRKKIIWTTAKNGVVPDTNQFKRQFAGIVRAGDTGGGGGGGDWEGGQSMPKNFLRRPTMVADIFLGN